MSTLKRGFFLLLFSSFSICQTTDILKSRTFKVSAIPIQGYMKIEETQDGNYTISGIKKDFYDVLFDSKAGYKYAFVVINATVAAKRGFTQASIDQLLNKDVDISSLGYVVTAERLRFMDFTVYTSILPYAFLLKYPETESPLWGPIRPFQSIVWFTFVISIIAVIIALTLLSWSFVSGSMESKPFFNLFSDNTIFTITLLISNAEYYRGSRLSLRMLLAALFLTCVVIINSYTGNLTSCLTFPALQPIPNSFEELAARKDLNVIVEDKSVLAELLLSAYSGPLKVLGDSLRRNPNHLFRTVNQSEELLYFYHAVYPGVVSINYFAMARFLDRFGTCGLTMSKPIALSMTSSTGLQKNSPYLAALNMRIHRINEMGLMLHLQEKYLPRVEKCLMTNREKPKISSMKLDHFQSAFILFLCGIGISVIVFILECLCSAIQLYLQIARMKLEAFIRASVTTIRGIRTSLTVFLPKYPSKTTETSNGVQDSDKNKQDINCKPQV